MALILVRYVGEINIEGKNRGASETASKEQ